MKSKILASLTLFATTASMAQVSLEDYSVRVCLTQENKLFATVDPGNDMISEVELDAGTEKTYFIDDMNLVAACYRETSTPVEVDVKKCVKDGKLVVEIDSLEDAIYDLTYDFKGADLGFVKAGLRFIDDNPSPICK